MKAAILTATLALAALALPASSWAKDAAVQATRAWSRPAAAGGSGAGFVTLTGGAKPDALVSAESPAAQKVELHSSEMHDGMMHMAPETKLDIPAHGQVQLAPGGRHLMLLGLKRPLKVGDRVPAILHFASGATLKVEFKVAVSAPQS